MKREEQKQDTEQRSIKIDNNKHIKFYSYIQPLSRVLASGTLLSIEMAILNLKGCILVNYLKELIRVHSLYCLIYWGSR